MSMAMLVAAVGMISLAMAALLIPLFLRQRMTETREAYNLAVYRDQLAEIERDIERGVLSPEQVEAARVEISRRMLALSPGSPSGAGLRRRPSAMPLAIATVTVAMLPFAALALYWQLGSPNLPDEPFADRGPDRGRSNAPAVAGGAPHIDMAQAVVQLTAHLKQSPDDLNGWVLLGRSYLSLGRYQDAADAYRHAAALSGQRPDILGDYGEALMLAAGGTITPAAREAFEAGLKDPETAPRSRYYLALAELQHGNTRAALQGWVDLEADSPADAEWLPLLRKRIQDAANAIGVDAATLRTSAGATRAPAVAGANPPANPSAPNPQAGNPQVGGPQPAAPASSAAAAMPSPAAVAEAAQATAGASSEDRQAMIRAMVARLADRLRQQPNDGEGWARLGRSYMVLNEPDKARDAYAHAVKLKPDDVPLKLAYAESIIADTGDNSPSPPPEVIGLMRQVLQADPENREALWYVGIAEAEAGHAQAAYDLWSKLLAQLPTSAPERREVEQRLAALNLGPAK